MSDKYRTTGSDGVVERFVDKGSGTGTNYWARVVDLDASDQFVYPVTPVVTVYSPSTTSYIKITPDSTCLKMVVRPRTTTHALIYAPLITHKIADTTTTISSADADDLAKSKTLVDELKADTATHLANTAYHAVAGTTVVYGHKAPDTTNTTAAANMSDLATGYTLADELAADITAHVASTTYHLAAGAAPGFPGTPDSEPLLTTKVNAIRTYLLTHLASTACHSVADTTNLALVTATTPGTTEGTTQTLINLLKSYWNSHCGIGATNAADLAAVVAHANACKAGLLVHYASTTVHGGTADATNLATLTAVAAASDLATAETLVNAEKATYNLHCAVLDSGAYITVGAGGVPLVWDCLGAFWAKTDNSGGVITTSEFRSA